MATLDTASTPAGQLENGTVSGHIVLHAEKVALAFGVEETTGGLGVQIIQRDDANTAVAQRIRVRACLQAGPGIIVVGINRKPQLEIP